VSEWNGSPGARAAARKYGHKKYAETRPWLDEIKLAAGCVDCGYREHACALQFDHVDPKTKSFVIAHSLMRSKERLLEEIAKCEVRCANCHAVRTKANHPRLGRPRVDRDAHPELF